MPYSLESLKIGSVLQLRQPLDTKDFYIPTGSFVQISNILLRQSRRYPFSIGRFYEFSLIETTKEFVNKKSLEANSRVTFTWRESTLATRFYYFRARRNE